MSIKINEQWCSIDSEQMSNMSMNNVDKYQKMEERFKEMEQKILHLEKEIKKMELQIHSLSNENLKMVNRVLEAEISLERAKNSLVRKHIPFPFTPLLLPTKFSL